MSAEGPSTVRTLAFGDLDAGIWGVAAVSAAGATASFADPFELDGGGSQDEWLLSGAGVELRLSASSDPAPFGPEAAGIGGFAQLCDVRGALHRDGSEQDVACFGIRTELAVPPVAAASARIAAAWFGPELGFALLSMRPVRAAGHDADAVVCALIEDGHALDVDEPRLSSTYKPSGLVLRAGLELWPVEPPGLDDESEAADSDGAEQTERLPYYPRRVGGETAGDGSELALGGLELRAELFRWRTRGREGTGVYVLAPAP
jgi:hypothetical protein